MHCAGTSVSGAWSASEPGSFKTWGANVSWLLGMGRDDGVVKHVPEKGLCPKRLGELLPLQLSLGGQHGLVLVRQA